jgi:hypothetical protein
VFALWKGGVWLSVCALNNKAPSSNPLYYTQRAWLWLAESG